eukprot:scaffold14097_cov107-Isochrysis_galbana.AAC.6
MSAGEAASQESPGGLEPLCRENPVLPPGPAVAAGCPDRVYCGWEPRGCAWCTGRAAGATGRGGANCTGRGGANCPCACGGGPFGMPSGSVGAPVGAMPLDGGIVA